MAASTDQPLQSHLRRSYLEMYDAAKFGRSWKIAIKLMQCELGLRKLVHILLAPGTEVILMTHNDRVGRQS